MIDPAVIAARVRNARRLARLTQAEAADAAGISRVSLSQLERGHMRNPTVGVINWLAGALHTTPCYLLGITEEIGQ